MYVISDSPLFFRRGGPIPKNERRLAEVATFLCKATKGLVLKDIVSVTRAKRKGLCDEVSRIMQFIELAPPGCNDFGLARRAVLLVFWNCNSVASQPARRKPKWAEALQSDVERLVVQMSSFQYR